MQMMCKCGRTLNPDGYCDASHALSLEQYNTMIERRRQIFLAEYQRKAMEQWFEDGSCTGGEIKKD